MISDNLDRVQRTIINIHRMLFDESPSPMKLQKLCYYAQSYALAEGNQLFDEDFQAWQHGPVIRGLYDRYRKYEWRQISEDIGQSDASILEFITDIVSAYGRYDGAALSTMTHRESPWLDAREDLDESQGSTAIISKESMREFFAAKLRVANV
ncbi:MULTISPECIES: Panacea domain-containing protein [unclassified Spirulina]|uniref:Panacea domain-containing protein n=1 Tax=unclassified Spirulina TaxID=2684457 RepID=UPI00194F7FE3|nr:MULTISPECIES: type II toxin-antitoxin system antitoxin SocA domain-containing protein [Spirulina]MEA5472100.1 type II toxin-antitoxin system antitoxin SocA domain-containing protein [Spirulina sp. 06S082]